LTVLMMLVAAPGAKLTLTWRLIGAATGVVASSRAVWVALKRRPRFSIMSGVNGIASCSAFCAVPGLPFAKLCDAAPPGRFAGAPSDVWA
jgi:hypothetical protein